MSYRHILLVTDLRADADLVADKAKYLLNLEADAKLSVLHIVKDSMVGFGYELIPASSLNDHIDDEKCAHAKQALQALLRRTGLSADHIDVTTAISSGEGIVHYCQKHKVDLLVIGRHERHGLSAWINGATVDNIMPNIGCDILVVRLDQPV